MNIEINDEEINVKEIIMKMKAELGKYNINEELPNMSFERYENSGASGAANIDIKGLYNKVDIINKSWHSNPEFTITSHRKFLGPFIITAKKIIRKITRWYLIPYANLQNEFNGNMTRTINEIFTQFINTNDQLQTINQQLDEAKTQLSKKDDQIITLQNQFNKVLKKFEDLNETEYVELSTKVQKLEVNINSLELVHNTKIETINTKMDSINAKVESLNTGAEISAIKNNSRVAVERLRRIERKLKQIGDGEFEEITVSPIQVDNNASKKNQGLDFDYFLFEEYYRGSREEIINRQKQYLPYFSDAKHVLDLGCGRGEFTELLLQEGINVVSVDLDDDMVEYCSDRGFNITKMNLIDYLQTIEDNSVDGIFLGQVIEHMKAEDLILMVKLAYKKLKPNSWLIAETPNPRSLSIFAQSFYLDLTHNKPVHPFTSTFIWETEGFREVEVQYFSPNNPIVHLPPLEIDSMDQDVLKRFNTGLHYWNETVFGYQDYFVAGKK